jgi:4-diphosphocytidyl-2-C-methyl-D-erythritol kinase
MTTLSLAAPAKINWTLEVLGKRPDGYHEVRTIFQTINLYDTLILSPADGLSLTVRGARRGFRRDSRAAPEGNLVYRAARLLQERTGCGRGADIRLHKNIPVAAGLGGGSSDAAAALRGLRELWELPISDDELAGLAASLGSDVPFFLRGGAALASGRGEVLRPLPDGPAQHFVLAWPKSGERPPDKTARMYAALRSEHYTDGARTESLAARIRAGQPVRDEDCFNVFEAVLGEVDPTAAALFERAKSLGNAHLCGSGPAVFLLVDTDADPEGARRACHETAKIYGSSSLAMTIRAGEAAG